MSSHFVLTFKNATFPTFILLKMSYSYWFISGTHQPRSSFWCYCENVQYFLWKKKSGFLKFEIHDKHTIFILLIFEDCILCTALYLEPVAEYIMYISVQKYKYVIYCAIIIVIALLVFDVLS